jgi:hypothetical protein
MMWRTALGAHLLLAAFTLAPTANAAPVEYVRVCSLYGAGFFYIPGTDTCLNPNNGEVRTQTAYGTFRGLSNLAGRIGALEGNVSTLESEVAALRSAQQPQMQARFDTDFRNAMDGSAIAMALDEPYLTESEHFGIKLNWGTYNSSNAFGVTFAGVLAQHGGNRLTLSGGVAFTGNNVGGHAGLQFSW